jgi:hypothetical protein
LYQKDLLESHCREMVSDKQCNLKLDKIRASMLLADPVLVTAPHYDKLKKLIDSPLYEVFKMMPKPAIHHTHLTACADKKFLLKLTYHDQVYYSQKENAYYVNKTKPAPPGYLSVNTLRAYSKDSRVFDD